MNQSSVSDFTNPAQYTVLLFASLKDAANSGQVSIQASPEACTVESLLKACAVQYPQIAPWLPHVRVAVNCEYVGPDQVVGIEDEIALLPPVSGGS